MTRISRTFSRTTVAIVAVVVVIGLAFGAGMATSTSSDAGTQDVSTVEQAQADQNGVLDQLMGEDGLTRTGDSIIYTAPAGDSFSVSNLTVEDADGDMISVTADVGNANDWLSVQHVELRVDGEVVDRRPFALDPNETESIEFMIDTSEWSEDDHVVSVLTYDHGAVTTVSAEGPVEPTNASVTFEDQTSDGMTVTVDEVRLPDGGFVAIHDTASLAQGDALGSTIGVSDYLSAGTHENVTVTLFEVPGAETNATMLENDTELTAMPHLDTNENETFEFVSSAGADDGPYIVDGAPVVDDAMITLETSQPEEPTNASVTFEDQTSDGMTVSVDEVTLPDGGFVVIHETASLAEGDALGSTIGVSEYLSAGTHENVTVTLFEVPGAETNATMLEDDTELTAMAHLDTNENETFEFVSSAGADDGPYVVDGAAVVDDAMITVETSQPTTEEPTNETTTEEPVNETTTEEPANETTTEEPTNES